MRISILATVPILAALAACGGSVDSEAPVGQRVAPADSRVGFPSVTPSFSAPLYEPLLNRVQLSRVEAGGAVSRVTLPANTGGPIPRPTYMVSFGGNDSAVNAVRGETPSGAGVAYAAKWDGDYHRGHQRLTDTVLPPTGSAAFNGGYMGVLGDRTTGVGGFVSGSARLNIDWDAMRISGSIENRSSNTGNAFAPLNLTATGLNPSTGGFGGVTSGGQQILPSPSSTSATGSFSGLVTGSTAKEVVGGVNLAHSANGTTVLREFGAFVAVSP